MIIVFGAIFGHLQLEVDTLPGANETVAARDYRFSGGGKAANQALAAARAGAKVSLIGKIGEDELGTEILNHLRREGITTSGVAHGEQTTGTIVQVRDKAGLGQTIHAFGANAELTAEQIPEEILDEKTLLLLQTDIARAENVKLMQQTKAAGGETMMNLSPSIDLKQDDLDHLDYLIVNQDEARQLAEKLSLNVEDNALKMAQGLARQGDVHCIITIGSRGSVAVMKDGSGWSVEALNKGEIADRSGAGDAYCGTLASCIQSDLPLPRAMKRASIAASLTCMQKGTQNAFPGLEEIDKEINNIKDPEPHEL